MKIILRKKLFFFTFANNILIIVTVNYKDKVNTYRAFSIMDKANANRKNLNK